MYRSVKFLAVFLAFVCACLFPLYSIAATYIDTSAFTVQCFVKTTVPGETSDYYTLTENVVVPIPPPEDAMPEGYIDEMTYTVTFSSSEFILGQEYYFEIVLFSYEGSYNISPGSIAGQFFDSGQNTSTNFIWDTNVFLDYSFDTSKYPNELSYGDTVITDEEYAQKSVLVTGSFTPNSTTGSFYLMIPLSGGYHVNSTAYSHLAVYTDYVPPVTPPAGDGEYDGYLQRIIDTLDDTYSLLSSNFYSILSSLTSIRTVLSNGFAILHDDLGALLESFGEGFVMSEADEKEFEEMEDTMNEVAADIDKESAENNAAIKENNDKLDKLDKQQEDSQKKQDSFKGSWSTAGSGDIISSITSGIGNYAAGLEFWGAFFGEVFSFAPLRFMLQVTVFFGLLMVLFGASCRNIVGSVARERRRSERIQYEQTSSAGGGMSA